MCIVVGTCTLLDVRTTLFFGFMVFFLLLAWGKRVVRYYVILYYAMLCFAMLCYATLCYATLCYGIASFGHAAWTDRITAFYIYICTHVYTYIPLKSTKKRITCVYIYTYFSFGTRHRYASQTHIYTTQAHLASHGGHDDGEE